MTERKVTSAADYGRLSETKLEGELVDMPSGAVFRMRRADFDALVMMGAVPQTLVSVGMKAWKMQGKLTDDMLDQAIEKVVDAAADNPEETQKDLIFMRELVRDNVLEPRIGYDEMGAVALLDDKGAAVTRLKSEDFNYALDWIIGEGGTYRDNLERFRSGRERRAAAAGVRSKKSRNAPQPVS